MADAHPTPGLPAAPSGVRPGVLFRHDRPDVTFKQHFVPETANLQFLNCGEYTVPPGAASVTFCRPAEESLLFLWKGAARVEVDGQAYDLAHYDTLYVPRGAGFRLSNGSGEPAVIIQCAAPAATAHPVFHSRFAEFSQREDRIRHLAGKDVFLMFDVGEAADKLVAGYTFYQPHTRAWPPHNHTDQEEVYIFIDGHGAMEVYRCSRRRTRSCSSGASPASGTGWATRTRTSWRAKVTPLPPDDGGARAAAAEEMPPLLQQRRWWILAMLFCVTMINFVDRQTLSVTAPILREIFSLTNTHYGIIVAAFQMGMCSSASSRWAG